jgi:hypothetical protein
MVKAMDEDQSNSKSEKNPESTHEFNLESVYANNSRFESSVWDLRVLFGQLEQHTGKEVIDWHTAVTLPWMQVKILIYYLRVNLAVHELASGPLWVHPNVTPQKPQPPPAEVVESNPLAPQTYEAVLKIHSEMFD